MIDLLRTQPSVLESVVCSSSVKDWESICRFSLVIFIRNARCNREVLSALSQQLRCGWTYAPRPALFPVTSSTTPSPVRTKRSKARLPSACRQAMQVRWGIRFRFAMYTHTSTVV